MPTLADNIAQAIADFDDIQAAINAKGGNAPDGTPTSDYGDIIRALGGGGAQEDIEGWTDIKQILLEDTTEGFGGKYIQLITDHDPAVQLTGALAYRTSDGAYYSTATATHTWDDTQDIPCNMEYKTRWILAYTNANSAISLQNNTLWVVLDLMLSSVSSISSKKMLKRFEFADGKNLAPTLKSVAGMFRYCYTLTKVPDVLDLSSATNVSNMFEYCYTLTKVPDVLDLSSATNVSNMFYSCSSLTKVPDVLDLSSATNVSNMFNYCYSLTKVPDVLDLSSATNVSNMFYNCRSLTKVPDVLDLSSATNVNDMFYSCISLTKVPDVLDLSSATNVGSMFYNCAFLKSFKITGLKVTCSLSSSTYFTHEDLLYTIEHLQTVTGQTLTLGSVNLEKLTADEKAIATGKGWTIN